MAKLTLFSAPTWMRETFKPYRNAYQIDKDAVINLLPHEILTALGGYARVEFCIEALNQQSHAEATAELEQFIAHLSFQAPGLANALMKVINPYLVKDNVWTDLKQPIDGIANLLIGAGSAILSLVIIIKNLLLLPIDLFDKGWQGAIANLYVSLQNLWSDFKTLLNGLLQIIATPALLVRIPARLLAKADSDAPAAGIASGMGRTAHGMPFPGMSAAGMPFPGMSMAGMPPELSAVFASAMQGMSGVGASARFPGTIGATGGCSWDGLEDAERDVATARFTR